MCVKDKYVKCKGKLKTTYTEGYDVVTEIPKYDNVTTQLCKKRWKGLGIEENPEHSSKIVFSEEVLRLANNFRFLRIDHTDDVGKIILDFAGEDSEYLLRIELLFF